MLLNKEDEMDLLNFGTEMAILMNKITEDSQQCLLDESPYLFPNQCTEAPKVIVETIKTDSKLDLNTLNTIYESDDWADVMAVVREDLKETELRKSDEGYDTSSHKDSFSEPDSPASEIASDLSDLPTVQPVGVTAQHIFQKITANVLVVDNIDRGDLFPDLDLVDIPSSMMDCQVAVSDADKSNQYLTEHQIPPVSYEVDIPTSPCTGDNEALVPEFDMLIPDHIMKSHKDQTILSYYTDGDSGMVSPASSRTAETSDEDSAIMTDDDTDDDYIPHCQNRHKSSFSTSTHSVTGQVTKVRLGVAIKGQSLDKRSRRKSPQLWVFLLNKLCDGSSNPSLIKWMDPSKGIFKLTQPHELSTIWGSRVGIKEGKQPMNYEKFSRAMRYYYKDNVLKSYKGRLTYQFGPMATGWKDAARNYHQS